MKLLTVTTFFLLVAAGCNGIWVTPSASSTHHSQEKQSEEPTYLCAKAQLDPLVVDCQKMHCNKGMMPIFLYPTKAACLKQVHRWKVRLFASDHPATSEQQSAFEYLNRIRGACKLPLLRYNKKLESAALHHQYYIGDIHRQGKGFFLHGENNRSYPSIYYTGDTLDKRLMFVGYKLAPFAAAHEVITYTQSDTLASIKLLLATLYHRHALLDSGITEIGMSHSIYYQKIHPHLLGNSLAPPAFFKYLSPPIITYPYDGQKDVTPTFEGEIPDPVPTLKKPCGIPISIIFNDYKIKDPDITQASIIEKESGKAIDFRLIDATNDPAKRLSGYEFALFPIKPLKPETTYCVTIFYDAGNEINIRHRWCFDTL